MKVSYNIKADNTSIEVVKGLYLDIWEVNFKEVDFDIHERACPHTPGVDIGICQLDDDGGGVFIEGTFYDGDNGARFDFCHSWASLTDAEVERDNHLYEFLQSARGLAFIRAAVEAVSK